MAQIDQILQRIEGIYQRRAGTQVDVPITLRAHVFAGFASDYIAAATVLDREAPQHWLPLMQLTGHAVELSLKSCIAAAGITPPHGHDLVALCRTAQEQGFDLEDNDFAAVVHLHHFYYRDLSTQTKFKARYPTERDEPLGGSVPRNSTFVSIVDKLLVEAKQKERK